MNSTNLLLNKRLRGQSYHKQQSVYKSSLNEIMMSIQQIQMPTHVDLEQTPGTQHPFTMPMVQYEDLKAPYTRSLSNRLRKHQRSPAPLRSQLISRRSGMTPMTFRSLNIPQMLGYEKQFAETIKIGDMTGCLSVKMMIVAVEQDDILLLITLFRLNALTFLMFKEWNKAILLLSHCIYLSKYVPEFDIILWSLQQIGIVCKYLKKCSKGKLFMKKALEIAWYLNDVDEELRCYEELGKLCFLNYELHDARQLHEKSVTGQNEPPNSAMRQVSQKGFSKILQMLPEPCKQINPTIMAKALNFPFRFISNSDAFNIRKTLIKNEYMISSQLACVSSNRLTENDLTIDDNLDQLLKGEFFTFEIPLPINSNFREESTITITQPLTQREKMKQTELFTQVKLSTSKALKMKASTRDSVFKLDLPSKKLPLEQLVKERLLMKIQMGQTHYMYHKSPNMEPIRLTHEEHTKSGILQSAQRMFSRSVNRSPKGASFTQIMETMGGGQNK